MLADSRAVIRMAQRFLARHPRHALAGEVTDMMCRAHREPGDRDLPSACLLR